MFDLLRWLITLLACCYILWLDIHEKLWSCARVAFRCTKLLHMLIRKINWTSFGFFAMYFLLFSIFSLVTLLFLWPFFQKTKLMLPAALLFFFGSFLTISVHNNTRAHEGVGDGDVLFVGMLLNYIIAVRVDTISHRLICNHHRLIL